MRKDVLGQPTGTFGAHRGADLKHQSHHKYSSSAPVPKVLSLRFLKDPPFAANLEQLHQVLWVQFISLEVARQSGRFPETTKDETHKARFNTR